MSINNLLRAGKCIFDLIFGHCWSKVFLLIFLPLCFCSESAGPILTVLAGVKVDKEKFGYFYLDKKKTIVIHEKKI